MISPRLNATVSAPADMTGEAAVTSSGRASSARPTARSAIDRAIISHGQLLPLRRHHRPLHHALKRICLVATGENQRLEQPGQARALVLAGAAQELPDGQRFVPLAAERVDADALREQITLPRSVAALTSQPQAVLEQARLRPRAGP